MDYEEFCMATDNNYELLQQIYHMNSAIGQATNRKLMRDLRIYMAVGGMPQAVEAYIEGKNFSEIDMVKRQIIALYEEDFKKIDASGRISALYHSIPAQLAKDSRKYRITTAIGKRNNTKADELLLSLIHISEFIQKAVGGDLFEVETVNDYSKDYHKCTEEAGRELKENARPELKKYLDDISDYDNIFVCGPCCTDIFKRS